MTNLFYIIAILGIFASVFIAGSLILIAWNEISNLIKHMKCRYHYLHRFNKKPIAKCYCIDCINYIDTTHRCCLLSADKYVLDNWFCADAKPKKKKVKK